MLLQKDLVATAPNLRKFALRLTRNVSDADDLVQSTVLRAIEKAYLFETGTDVFRWTSKIMFNIFVSGYRRKTKFETQYDPEPQLASCSVEANQEAVCDLKRVKEAMNELSADHKEILLLVCIKGMQYEEVAEVLSIPVGTVRSRLSRARESLQKVLQPTATHLPLSMQNNHLQIAAA